MERVALTAFHRASMARRSPSSAIPPLIPPHARFRHRQSAPLGVIGGWYVFQPEPRQQREVSRLVTNLF